MTVRRPPGRARVCVSLSVTLILSLVLASRPAVAQQAVRSPVTGVVIDATGAVLPNAGVELRTTVGVTVESTVTDSAGAFRIEGVAPGRYQIVAVYEGFRPTTLNLTVGNRASAPLRVTLPLAGVTQEVTVSNLPAQLAADATSNRDAVTVDQDMLQSLPVFDQDYIATMSRFLDAGSLGTGGVSVVVNGMEVSGLNVSASAVQQIKINQDPYSAEYSRQGRGRIEILTKPGSQQYHGDANVIVRDAQFNARNAFAPERVPEQRRIFEGFLGGPVGKSGKTSFMLSLDDDADDQQAVVYAVGPSGTINDSVPQPRRRALVSGSVTHQRSAATTISVRPAYQYENNENQGVGGVTLATAGTNASHEEASVTYLQQTIIGPTLLHQFQILAGAEREPATSVSADRRIVVTGAFTGGGAQSDLLRTERHIQLNESLAWTRPHHLVQAGFQLPDWSRRRFDDHTDFGGTFYFSGLNAYTLGRPYSFTQQQGNGDVAFLEKQVGAYVKDDWQIGSGLSASFGLRYDWQNYFHDGNNLALRMSFAYAPGNSKTTVIRGGAGRFNDRSGPAPIADLLHYQDGGLTRYVVTDPSYPDPFQSGSGSGAQPPSIVQLAPDVEIPYTWQYSAGIDHQLRKGTTLSVTYTGAHGHHLFRSRDVNAPQPPLYLARPDLSYGAVRQIESTGRQETDSVQVTLRGTVVRWFNGQMQYAWGRAYNDTNGINAYPANDYDLSGEWARADFDRRHRFLLLGRVSPGRVVDLGIGVSLNSGGPFTETLGVDLYSNGRGRARPLGVSRNGLDGAGYASVDLRASRSLTFGKGTPQERSVVVALDAFNVMNRVNYTNYVGTRSSSLFQQPVAARDPRQLQLSLRLKF